MAILLQSLALTLGIATERDLAQMCREHYSRPVSMLLWIGAEIAIAACDLAEVIGSAIALQLLFGIPLILGIVITSVDVLLILLLQHRGFRYLEVVVIVLIGTVALLFGIEVGLSGPEWAPLFVSFIKPPRALFTDPDMLYIGITILGAIVMPHNLYLHSSIVETRRYPRSTGGQDRSDPFRQHRLSGFAHARAVRECGNSRSRGCCIPSWRAPRSGEIGDAYKLLAPMLGAVGASVMFAVALLASGQNSTITGTLAGQVVMEGFLNITLPGWLRRLITRLIAIVPAVIVTAIYGMTGTGKLLLLSQAVLSMQLSFAVFPLVAFTSDKLKMGQFVNGPLLRIASYGVAVIIAGLNLWLLIDIFRGRS